MQAIDVKLPRPRSQLPILSDFTLPLPNTDQFYFSQELWDPLTRRPLKNQFGLKPALKGTTKKKTMPTTASKKKVVPLKHRSSQIDQLESETETVPIQERKTVKRTTSKDKGKGKAKDKEKEITRIVKSTKPSTSKRKRSTSPSHSHSTEQQPEPKRTNSANRIKEKLEQFRYNIKSDETPPGEIKADSSEPRKRQRPPKSDSPSLDVADQVEQRESEPPKKKKKRTQPKTEILEEPVPSHSPPRKQQKRKKEAAEVIFYMPEVDEDGNPISTSREPSPSPPHSLNNEICPITPIQSRSPSPIRHSPTRQPLLTSPRKLNTSPFRPSPAQNPLPKPSPFRPAHPHSRPTGDLPSFPSSSNSFDLPSEMAERIRNSGSSPERNELPEEDEVRERSSGRQVLSEEARRELEEVIEGFGEFEHEFAGFGEEGTLGSNEKERERDEDRTMVDENEEEERDEGGKDRIGGDFGQIPSPSASSIGSLDLGALADPTDFACPREFLPSQSSKPQSNAFLLPPESPFATLTEPAASTCTLKPCTNPASRAPRLLSATLDPHLRPAPRAAPPSHRLVPLTLPGLTSHLHELISTALSSSLPLSHFGLPSHLSSSGTEISYLRREVSRLTSEVVERDSVILELSERVREGERERNGLREEMRELGEVCDELGREKCELKEKEGWDKEKRKGLVRDLREFEERVEELEREKEEWERERSNGGAIRTGPQESVHENVQEETKE